MIILKFSPSNRIFSIESNIISVSYTHLDIFLNNVFEANENITNGVAIPNKYRTINITLFPVSPDEPAKINIEANIGPTQGVQDVYKRQVHEFLPKTLEDKKKMAEILSISLEDIEKRIYRLKDENPMLGHRGCRLGVSYPELYRIQARAIIEAAYECEKKGIKVHPEIMIPFIMEAKELEYLREEIQEEIENFFKEVGATVEYKLGTMIEIPRACLLANEIAEYADFFSFGTNDLTQMSMGLSRDDSVKFLDAYREKGIWEGEPFYSIDTKAVTKLVELGVKNGKIDVYKRQD